MAISVWCARNDFLRKLLGYTLSESPKTSFLASWLVHDIPCIGPNPIKTGFYLLSQESEILGGKLTAKVIRTWDLGLTTIRNSREARERNCNGEFL